MKDGHRVLYRDYSMGRATVGSVIDRSLNRTWDLLGVCKFSSCPGTAGLC